MNHTASNIQVRTTANIPTLFYTNDTLALTLDTSQNASFAGGVTIAGDLTVNGTTTTVNTSTLAVEDPLISMAKDNSANSVDIGFYGRYNDGSNRYLGLFADASNSNKFKLFKGLTTEPTTTVDTSDGSFAYADLVIGALSSGNITASGNITLNSRITFDYGGDHYFEAGTDTLSYKSSTGSGVVTFNASTLETSFGGDISLADSKYLYLGTSNDLQLYHDGTDSYISNTQNEGHLIIQNGANDKDVVFKCDNGDGGLETYFYLDGSSAESSTGIEVRWYNSSTFDRNFNSKWNRIIVLFMEMLYVASGKKFISSRNHSSGDLCIDYYADDSGYCTIGIVMMVTGENLRISENSSGRWFFRIV